MNMVTKGAPPIIFFFYMLIELTCEHRAKKKVELPSKDVTASTNAKTSLGAGDSRVSMHDKEVK